MTSSACCPSRSFLCIAALVLSGVVLSTPMNAQAPGEPKPPAPPPAFFDTETPVTLALTANLKELRGDKSEVVPWRPATIAYAGPDSASVKVPLRVRTRGIWRLKTCEFPPLRLNFSREGAQGTLFQGLDKPKLVSYCRNNDRFEQYVLQELQLYRIYHLLTPVSHKVRLVRLAYTDSAKGKVETTRYAILLEEPAAIAARLGGRVLEQKGALPGDLDAFHDALVGVFQYFIGNTDFSTHGLHNVELLAKPDGPILPLAYDFDFSGAVNASYATVDPRLSVTRVRDRLFRGFCTPREEFTRVFALFNDKRPQIYALYSDQVGTLMDRSVVKETLKYFDEFYRTINDPRLARRNIIDACIATPGFSRGPG